MYSHIKIGDLVRITKMNYSSFDSLPLYLVVKKVSETGFYCKCAFLLLDNNCKLIWFHANSNDPYNDIHLVNKN